jgi:hypothetical protein
MKLPLKLNRSIARLLMAVVLVTQWVLPASTYAAVPAAPAGAPVSGVMSNDGSSGMVAGGIMVANGMPCHGQAPGASACLAHCSQADQVRLDHAHLAAMPAVPAAWHVALPPAAGLPGRVFAPAAPHPGASPPLPILYCSLLN